MIKIKNLYPIILIICILLVKSLAIAQEKIVYSGKAVYDCVFMQSNPPSWTANLYYNNAQDKFFQDIPAPQKENTVTQQGAEMSITIHPVQDSVGKYVWASTRKKKLYSRTIVGKNKWVLVEEDLPTCTWAIIADSSKKIGSMNCQKAKSNFRGRDYELWFCPQMPVSQGPWKFNNLPGLAVSIKSTDGEVAFLLKENKIINGSKPAKHIYFKDEIVSKQGLKKLQEANRQRILKLMASFNDKEGSSTGTVSEAPDIEK